MRRAVLGWAGAASLYAGSATAHDAATVAERPRILMSRYDEDWRAFCAAPRPDDPLDRLKCLRLGPGGPTLSVGGELRERVEAVRNPVFGFDGIGRDDVLLHRVLLHTDLRLDESARVFVQLGHHLATDRVFGRAPTDVDRLDLQQGFVDLSTTVGDDARATVRFGRQEISFGSARLVSTRESPNVRRSFDGVRGFVAPRGWRIDVFAARPIRLAQGVFDDASDPGTALWGVYASGIDTRSPFGRLDLYYLGYTADDAAFAQGRARERRHSLGARLFGERGGFDWDVEAVYQSGSFDGVDIRAWTVASDSGFTLADLPWGPRIGLKADIASGDADPGDRVLGTFNALFPKFPYFTEANNVAPANLMDLQPSLTVAPNGTVEIVLSWDVIWKHRIADAFYAPPLAPIAGTAGGSRSVGDQASLQATWRATSHVTVAGSYVRFSPGKGLRVAGGLKGEFVAFSAAYKF